MSSGALLLGKAGRPFECSHQYGEGDRCLSFQFDPGLFERVARDVAGSSISLDRHPLPPLRALAPLTARARTAVETQHRDQASFEEIAFDLAGAVVRIAAPACQDPAFAAVRDRDRIAGTLRELESSFAQPHALAELAQLAGLSTYHFLRTFKRVTGVTPHQWILRARLRDAAQRLVASRTPITEIALDVGFEDLSNFIRSFRAEFGVSPSRYRITAPRGVDTLLRLHWPTTGQGMRGHQTSVHFLKLDATIKKYSSS
jgi:AraC-like DNA-binding protein